MLVNPKHSNVFSAKTHLATQILPLEERFSPNVVSCFYKHFLLGQKTTHFFCVQRALPMSLTQSGETGQDRGKEK